jgi:hypothetical protein
MKRMVIFFNWYSGDRVQLGSLGAAVTNRSVVPAPGDYDDGEIGGMMIGRGDRSSLEKTCPSAALSTTNTTCCPDANPGRRGKRIVRWSCPYALGHEGVWESGCADQRISDIGINWRLGGSQKRYGRSGEDKNLTPIRTRTPTLRSPSLWPVALPTELSRRNIDTYILNLRMSRIGCPST